MWWRAGRVAAPWSGKLGSDAIGQARLQGCGVEEGLRVEWRLQKTCLHHPSAQPLEILERDSVETHNPLIGCVVRFHGSHVVSPKHPSRELDHLVPVVDGVDASPIEAAKQ